MQSRTTLRDLLVAPNNSVPRAATPSSFGQNPSIFSSTQAMPQFCSLVEATPSSSFQLSTPIGLTPMPSPTLLPSFTAQSLPPQLPDHLLPAHPLPAPAYPPFSTSQLQNDCQLGITPQILELLNLIQMVQGQNLEARIAPMEPEAPSSSQTPVNVKQSSTQTEAHAGPSLVERAVSPTAPFGIVSMEEEMQNLKSEKSQLQEDLENELRKFKLKQRQMSVGHQKKMSETMKRLKEDFEMLSSADKKTVEDLKLAGSKKDAKIGALEQENEQFEAEKESLMNENENMKIQMIGEQCVRELEILFLQIEIEVLTNGETKKIVQLIDENVLLQQEKETLESVNEKNNQELLRMQCELAARTEKIHAQEEELQELRRFKMQVQVENLRLKKSVSPEPQEQTEGSNGDSPAFYEEAVYTEMPEAIAEMPKEEKFSEVLEQQKDDNELWLENKKEIESLQKRLDRAETELMEKHSSEGLRQEILGLLGHIKQFKKKSDTLRSEYSTLEKENSSMRNSIREIQFLKDAKVAELDDLIRQEQDLRVNISNLQHRARGLSDVKELQQKMERYQKMIRIYEDQSEKILVLNNGHLCWRGKQGQPGSSAQTRAAKRPRQ